MTELDLVRAREIAIDTNEMIQRTHRDKHSQYGILWEQIKLINDGLVKLHFRLPLYVIDDPENSGNMKEIDKVVLKYNQHKDNKKMVEEFTDQVTKLIERYEQKTVAKD